MGQQREGRRGLEPLCGVLDDVVLDIVRGNAGRRGWVVVHVPAFAGGHIVTAERAGYEIRAVDERLATAAVAVMETLARLHPGAV